MYLVISQFPNDICLVTSQLPDDTYLINSQFPDDIYASLPTVFGGKAAIGL